MTDQPYPAEALTAAISAYNKSYLTSNSSNPRFVEKVVTAVLEAAAPLIAAQAAAAVCDWLVTEVGFPFDFTFGDKPAWLDLHQVAEAWHRHDPSEDVETWLLTIIDETGWEATGAE
jgi:hypothetical protein